MEDGVPLLCETLAIALRQRQRPLVPIKGKYDGLVANAVTSAEELETAARSARHKNLDIETVLMDEYRVKPSAIGESLATYFGVPYEPFKPDRVKPFDLLKNLNREFLESSVWVPIDDSKEGMVVLTTDPEKLKGSHVVNNVYPKGKITYRVCCNHEFTKTLDQLFGATHGALGRESIGDLLSDMQEDVASSDDALEDMKTAAADNEVVKLVNKIIVDAYQQGASDIHIEPYPGKGKTEIRFRKDGLLQPYISVPHGYRNAIAARVKIMCDLDISERRKPQDGKIQFKKFGPLDIELRVASVPSQGGLEDIVMRILGGGEPMPIDKLALSKHNLDRCKDVIAKPYGLFFVCGPTGSGKTTTLHSVLAYLNTPTTKIWTAEDPVEITQRGLRQVQMNPKAGLTFAVAMRAFLRCDPDIIMVGEMRDKETVSTGIEASLTGHLVFATLHTNSAPESIVRLLDMGMDPFNFADALLGILAQRLARRLCASCKKPQVATEAELKALLDEYSLELAATETWKRNPELARQALLQGLDPGIRQRAGRRHALCSHRLRRVQRHGLQGTRRPARASRRHRRDQEEHPGARARRRHVRHGDRGGHAHVEAGRHRESPPRGHRHPPGPLGLHQVARAMPAAARNEDPSDLFLRLTQLNDIGVALSRETDIARLLEAILVAAKSITNADGGTLYRVTDERMLQFEIMRNDTLGIAMGGTTGTAITFPRIALFDRDGVPVTSMVAAYCVHHGKSVNIVDAYDQQGFDFSGTKSFDRSTGYRSRSFRMKKTQPAERYDSHRLTVSTSGWLPGIERLTRDPLAVRLAVSLHAPNDAVRDALVPLNRRYPVADLLGACRDYQRHTGRRVTFEYTLMDGVNDAPALAVELATLLAGMDAHVNLIPMNPVAGLPFAPSAPEAVEDFHAILRQRGLICTVRREMGRDIQAACGQLQAEVKAAAERASPASPSWPACAGSGCRCALWWGSRPP